MKEQQQIDRAERTEGERSRSMGASGETAEDEFARLFDQAVAQWDVELDPDPNWHIREFEPQPTQLC